jgi:hypothetical protein
MPTAIMGPVLDIVVISYVVIADTVCEELGRHVNMGLLCLVRAHCFTSSVVTPRGYKSRWTPLHTLHLLTQSIVLSSPPSLCLKRRERKKEGKKREIFWDLESAASPFLSSHGRTRLDPLQGHAWSHAKPCEPSVYDGEGVCGLPHA